MPSDPLVVRSGVLGKKEWDELQLYAQSGDERAWGLRARQLCERNVELWGMLVHGYGPTPHLRPYYTAAERYRNRLMSAGRGSFKSHGIVIRGQTHEMAYGTLAQSEMQVPKTLLIQESNDMAVATLKACETTIENGGPDGLLHAMFPDIMSRIEMRSGEWWLKTRWASKEPHFMGVGVGGAITGMHPRRIIMDDPTTSKNARTQASRALHWEWWSKSVRPMLMDTATIDIVHTPYFKGDLPNLLATQDPTFYSIKLPSLTRMPRKGDWVEIKDDNNIVIGVHITAEGMELQALWPCPLGTGRCPRTAAHFEEYGYHNSVEYLVMEYMRDPIGFASQHMLQLLDETNTRVKPEMLRYWSGNPGSVGVEAPNGTIVAPFPEHSDIVASVHGWDHAIGKKSHHDRTAVSMQYRTKDNRVFVRNRYGRWSFPEAVRTMESLAITDPVREPNKIVTEGMAFQEAYEQMLTANARTILPVESVKNHVDKDTALVESGLLSAMVRGEVYVELEDKDTHNELLSFTPAQNGGHDDIVDAMRIAYDAIRQAATKRARVKRLLL
jgi:phage terminase large subunit-like protein